MIENRSGKKLRILETSERSREVSKMAAERTEPDKVVPRPNPAYSGETGHPIRGKWPPGRSEATLGIS